MTSTSDHRGIVSGSGDGELIHITPLEPVRVKLSGDMGASTEVLELTLAPGGGPPLHTHRGQEETFVVLEGTLSAQLGDQRLEVDPGGLLHIPAGLAHAPFNATDADVRALIIGAPGFAAYFREIGEIITAWPPTQEMLEAAEPVMARYGVELAGPPPLAPQEG